MKPKAEWAIDSEAMKARRIIVLVKSNWLFKRNIETKNLSLVKTRPNPFLPSERYKYGGCFSLLVGYNI